MPSCLLLLGTNLGDKRKNLQAALQQIGARAGKIVQVSSIYETAPWGKSSEHSYYNQAVEIETKLPPVTLLRTLLDIELLLGRTRQEKWGDRILDIDILLYDQEVVQTEHLKIPHPEIANRRFVLVPLAEIAPERVHPVLKLSVDRLLKQCPDLGKVEKLLHFQ